MSQLLTEESLQILVVDDSEDDVQLEMRFARQGDSMPKWRRVDTESQMREALNEQHWDLVLSDYNLPSFSGPDAIKTLRESGKDIPLILVSGTIGEETAIEALKAGASDYVLKSNLGRLATVIERALREAQARRERRKLEEEIFRAHQFLSVILDSLPMAVYVCKAGGDMGITYVSHRIEAVTGYHPRQFIEHSSFWTERIHPEDSPRFFAELPKLFENGKAEFQFRFRVADGSYRHFYDILRLVRFPGTVEDSIVGVWIDVHEKVSEEARHQETEKQLREAQKMEAVGRLAGGVAHDVNNVLAASTLFAEMALDQIQSDPALVRESLEGILKSQESAASIIRQLLLFGRRRIGPSQVVDFFSILTGIRPLIRRLIGEDIELKIHGPSEPLPVLADRAQLEQIVLNLCVNARDAMPTGGKLNFTLEARNLDEIPADARISVGPGQYAVLTAQDSGCGIPAEVLPRIFEPFFTTKEPGKGTGLGLSVIYGILQQAGGTVTVESVTGQGTSIQIFWPITAQVGAVTQTVRANTREIPAPTGSVILLLVEDEESLRKIMAATLHKQGYSVLDAANGEEAVRFLLDRKKKIDLLITDVVMPRMSGPELVRAAREMRPDLPVLFLSGYMDGTLQDYGVDAASTWFMEKPFTARSLAEKVGEVLRSAVARNDGSA
ncbi:MAG: response regulator [Deltaproteobacteria bacterium]|nr:response regulator [Deltaproteobacteria bacterium]